MARSTRQRQFDPVRPKPKEEIELSEKHLKLRTVLMIVFLVLGVSALGYGVFSLLTPEPGWVEIKPTNNGQTTAAVDFVFYYYLDDSATRSEKRAVTGLYTQAGIDAYRLFTAYEEFEDTPNVASLNRHPNEEIQIDPALYSALALVQESGDRSLYLGPVYERYGDLFLCRDETETVDFDPYRNPEVAAEYAEAAAWANDKSAMDLELLEDNRVRLALSEEYLDWAEKSGVTTHIDFAWMKNAFIADYLADVLTAQGFTRATLSSFDGFIRNLDDSGQEYALSLYDRQEQELYPAAVMKYTGPAALVSLRDFPLSEQDSRNYYRYANGDIRTPYLDQTDGLCKSSVSTLLCCARGQGPGCAGILLDMIPVYVADSFREEALEPLAERGISAVYFRDGLICSTDPSLGFDNLYSDDAITYRVQE